MLSALITTPPNRSARASARLDLPLAVGPAISIARTCCGQLIRATYAGVQRQINSWRAGGAREGYAMRIDAIAVGSNPPEDVNVIIEVPIGGEPIKYEMDKAAGTLVVD